jgi:hypothetical protein
MIPYQRLPQPSESQYNRHTTDPCTYPQRGTIDRSAHLVTWLHCHACQRGYFAVGAPCSQPGLYWRPATARGTVGPGAWTPLLQVYAAGDGAGGRV